MCVCVGCLTGFTAFSLSEGGGGGGGGGGVGGGGGLTGFTEPQFYPCHPSRFTQLSWLFGLHRDLLAHQFVIKDNN